MAAKPTLAGWKKAANHLVQLPSGATCTVRVPNVTKMIMGGDFPNSLRDAGMRELTGQKAEGLTDEQMVEALNFTRYLVIQTVVEPKLTDADLDELPQEDIDLLNAFASRRALPADWHPSKFEKAAEEE